MATLKFVYQVNNITSKYSAFKHLSGNRYGGGENQVIINEKQVRDFENKVKTIQKSMKENGYDENFPIEVALINCVLFILDGQHRFEAARRCGIAIHYIVKPNITTIEQANDYCEKRNNAKRSSWNLNEYIYRVISDKKSYSEDVRKKYEQIVKWSEGYGVALGCLCDIAIGDGSVKTNGVIKKCKPFEIKNDVDEILMIASTIAKRHKHTAKLLSSRAFVRCVGIMVRNRNTTPEMKYRVMKHDFDFDMKRLNSNEYVTKYLQDVCNYRLHTKTVNLFD